jgi:hypothetical protein
MPVANQFCRPQLQKSIILFGGKGSNQQFWYGIHDVIRFGEAVKKQDLANMATAVGLLVE